jgi:hypothetical protein
MYWKDGAKYEGTWDYNLAAGQGKFTFVDGDVYDGNWSKN